MRQAVQAEPDLEDLQSKWGEPASTEDWPDPQPIQGELPPVQPFSEDLLPVSFRPLIEDVATRMQVPMDYPAAVMVLCLAGAVNRRARIQPKANDSGWLIVPNLWGGIIAPPGFMKTPVIQATTRPLTEIQAEWRAEHEAELSEYARDKEECDLRRSNTRKTGRRTQDSEVAATDRE